MSDPHNGLEIFIIGGRLGESIVIHTPGGQFGIVDAYASDWTNWTTNPTLLRLERLGAGRLRFVALTHPHMDHFRGLPSIFEAYPGKVDLFWRPPWGAVELISTAIREFKAATTRERRTQLGRSIKILHKLLTVIDSEVKKKQLRIKTLHNDSEAPYDGVMLQEPEHDFAIMCLGPSTSISTPYMDKISSKTIVPAMQGETPEWRALHNEISSVLAIKYGDWIGILGGDTEKTSWRDILQRRVSLLNSARFFKVSHHGSETGSFPELWDTIKSDKCEAVITCFAGQQLPNASGLQYLREPRFSIHSTNSALATHFYENRTKPIPYALKIDNRPGEVHVMVAANGEMNVEHVAPAGPVEL